LIVEETKEINKLFFIQKQISKHDAFRSLFYTSFKTKEIGFARKKLNHIQLRLKLRREGHKEVKHK